ncbi:MAG: bifunctional 5,10-methylenetetrahydrofolate dehydrogenase/5,10-methenyltetrahydrofolate cyclohydrolase [Erysipelotrichaceae bacterium]|nr:bifunctional 5,10-methylenetetrahydrofolate dehydrogenase/5,10-methenyltetrahydrofolate cyclohydrolase [Erysipelotrichaceae bacterium]
MAELLKGREVAQALDAATAQLVSQLKEKGIDPTLAIVRIGERSDDLSYERGAARKCQSVGITVRNVVLPMDVDKDEFYQILKQLNEDDGVHGILMLRPLPAYLDNERARNAIRPKKDVDGCSDASLTGIFTDKPVGFAPCTAEAVMAILKHYQIALKGRDVTVLGRSLVVGKPLAMMLLRENATVTVCHSRTVDIAAKARRAEILISCTGQMESVNREHVASGQTVIDVGISYNEKKQKLCGDCLFEEVEPIVARITPVPGGVGAVTTSILVRHVAEAADK